MLVNKCKILCALFTEVVMNNQISHLRILYYLNYYQRLNEYFAPQGELRLCGKL